MYQIWWTHHDALRKIGFANHDGTQLPQYIYENCVFGGWFERSAGITKGSVVTFDVELIFQANRDTVERSSGLSFLSIIAIELLSLS